MRPGSVGQRVGGGRQIAELPEQAAAWFQAAERSASKLAENVALAAPAPAPLAGTSRSSQQAASVRRVRLRIVTGA